VTRTLRPFSRVLRASFLVLLLLGLVSRPAPGLGCDLLAAEHGSAVAAGDHDAPQGNQSAPARGMPPSSAQSMDRPWLPPRGRCPPPEAFKSMHPPSKSRLPRQ